MQVRVTIHRPVEPRIESWTFDYDDRDARVDFALRARTALDCGFTVITEPAIATTTEAQRIAASELLAVHDFAMTSGHPEVQAFGVLMLARIADLVAGTAQPYRATDLELACAAEMFRTNVHDEETEGPVQ